MNEILSVVLAIVFILIGIGVYFLPSFVAGGRQKENVGAIVVLNLFLGWTFIGWVIALVWACMEDK